MDAAERKTLKSRRFSSPDFRSSRIGRACTHAHRIGLGMVGTKYIPILPLTTGLTGRAARKSERIVPRNTIELLFPSMVARSEERKLGCGVVGMVESAVEEM